VKGDRHREGGPYLPRKKGGERKKKRIFTGERARSKWEGRTTGGKAKIKVFPNPRKELEEKKSRHLWRDPTTGNNEGQPKTKGKGKMWEVTGIQEQSIWGGKKKNIGQKRGKKRFS